MLSPRKTRDDRRLYDQTAHRLRQMFAQNFEQFAPYVGEAVASAGPKAMAA